MRTGSIAVSSDFTNNQQNQEAMMAKGEKDYEYERLMSAYKELRMDPNKREESNKLLDKALELRKSGKVSEDAIISAQYL